MIADISITTDRLDRTKGVNTDQGNCTLRYPIAVDTDALDKSYPFKTPYFEGTISFITESKLEKNIVDELIINVKLDPSSAKSICKEFNMAINNFIRILMLRNKDAFGFSHKSEYISECNFERHFTMNFMQMPEAVNYLKEKDIQEALRCINKTITIQHFLLTSAHAFFYKNDFRNCILSCATVIEVCLSESIKKELSKDNDGVAQNIEAQDLIVKNCNGLVGMCGLLKKLHAPFSSQVTQSELDKKICKIRNKTIHSGYMPKIDEAKEAIGLCERVLQEKYSSIFIA